ncbi:hypothetical protein CNMCM6106_004647 [Aspergillus hiratsukae]|uniref:Uncharacterized protein n=1 Tax=Aspergillus hiratsukae TaxID=1194566 RepID=A0A8H6PJ38_9EURO|nr:hypothetical protein CNMCM6106_004647 [Aspergillus hiratsukae]
MLTMEPLAFNSQQLFFSIRTSFHVDAEPPLQAIIDESLESNIISRKCRRSLQQFPLKSFPLDPKRHIRDSYGTSHILTEQVELVINRDGSANTEQDWFLVSLADNLGPSDSFDVILGRKWKEKFESNRLKGFRVATTTYRDYSRERERAEAPSRLKSDTRFDSPTRTNDVSGLWGTPTHIPARRTRWTVVESGQARAMTPPVPEEGETRKGKEPIHRQRTALHDAARQGLDQLVRSILDEQENIDVNSLEKGYTPLHHAVQSGSESTAHLLLARGADPDIRDVLGRAPLHYAVGEESEPMVCLLLDKGANMTIQDQSGCIPLHYAVQQRSELIVCLLSDKGADVNTQNMDGWTPLHYAVREESEPMVCLLSDKGANMNIPDKTGRTPIHLAVQKEAQPMVCLLSEKGANVNTRDIDGRTPLHYAVHSQAVRMVKQLMGYGADPLRGDNNGITALHYAAMHRFDDYVTYITQHDSFSHHAEKHKPPIGPFIFL